MSSMYEKGQSREAARAHCKSCDALTHAVLMHPVASDKSAVLYVLRSTAMQDCHAAVWTRNQLLFTALL
jgi:hypothetical protein